MSGRFCTRVIEVRNGAQNDSATARDDAGKEHPISLMGFHHIHVRGDKVVAEWAEHNELALLAQLGR